MADTVAVLGAGSWGTTLAVHLARLGSPVRLWDHDRPLLALLDSERENRKFLSGIHLPESIKVQPELERALEGAALTLFVVPSHALRAVCTRVKEAGLSGIAGCATKGLELDTLLRPAQGIQQGPGGP